jgi:predicted dehydrogenase
MKKYTRRRFIKTTSGALAAALAPTIGFGSRTKNSAQTVSIGLIGCRNMGYWLMHHALNQPDIVCGGICDVDRNVLENRAKDYEKQTGSRPTVYSDYRKMLENSDIDAVIIGTPDHWHCLMAIHALQAGKHVYVEKPLARTIAEGELIKKAAEKYGKVVQVGQHQRSGEHWQKIVEMIQSGYVGNIRTINIWANFDYGQGPEDQPNEPVPEGVDYDMWLGPAPKRPFNPSRFHGNWRFSWDYGGGLITDWGAHLFDIPLWAMEIQGAPKSVSSIGGIFSGRDRAIDMADTQSVIYEFDDFNMVWEHNGGIETGPYERNYGIAFVGNKGTLVVNRESWEVIAETEDDKPLIKEIPYQESGKRGHEYHIANFIDAIRNGAELNCPAEAGNLAAYYGHIGNLAHRTNKRLTWDAEGTLMDKEEYSQFITPEYRDPWKLPEI